jgi:hypothetical protein
MIYYQITQFGLNAYTLKAPKCMLRVVDAQTGKFKMVAFNLAERSDLMIPMSYDMVKDLPNSHVSGLFLAAAHISLYVAHYEVISLPWWAKLLKIVQVVLFIMGLMGLTSATALSFMIKQILIHYAMKELMDYALEHFSPEIALIIIIAAYAISGRFKDLDLTVFLDLVNFLGDLTNVMGTVLEHYAYEELDDINDEQEKQELLQEKKMDALHEVQQALFYDNDGNPLDLTRSSRNVLINPMSPALYLSNSTENYHMIGIGCYNYDAIYDNMYEQKILTT